MADKKLKIVFMGTPGFAVPVLQALADDDRFDVVEVVTQEDKKVGRKQELTQPPVKAKALDLELPVLQPPKIRGNKEFLDLITNLKPDFIVVVAYGKLLPKELLEVPKYGCINIHGSLLPKYRGASPVEEAILHGDTETGISFIQMTEELDSGDILLIQRIKIDPTDNSPSLREKLSLLGALHLPFLLKDIVEGTIKHIPQDNTKATFCTKIKKEDGLIDLQKLTATEILNQLRAYTPWPSCFLVLGEKRIKIVAATNDESSKEMEPGTYSELPKGEIGLGTKHGMLILKEIQMEGKKPMKIQDFMRGNADFFRKSLASAK